MSRRRRAVVLGVLALLLGTLAATDVSGREAKLRDSLGPSVAILVTRGDVKAGQPLDRAPLAVRRIPGRYAPRQGFADPGDVAGLKAAVAIPAGTDVTAALVQEPGAAAGVPVGPGQRVADLVAKGSPQQVVPGSRVDVLVTRETGAGRGETTLALQDAEVIAAQPAPAESADDPSPRVAVSLRVKLRDAVYLAAAQSFAKELRVLPRAPGDRAIDKAGVRVGSGL